MKTYLGLLVVFHGHCDDIETDDNGDEQVQIVASAQFVDEQTSGGVIRVVRLTLGFYSGGGDGGHWGTA